jgi:hypothetical protein
MSSISYYYHLYVLYVLHLKKILFLQVKIKPNVNCKISVRYFSSSLHGLELGLTRESLFEILARSETRFLDPKFSRDFRETRESK